MTNPVEQNLIERIRAGEKHLFAELVSVEANMMRRQARRLLRNQADVDDVIQESLWKAFSRLHQFRGDSSLRTWLCSIVANESRARMRGTYRFQTRFENEVERSEPPVAVEHLERAETATRLRQALALLPEPHRNVLRMRFMEEKSVAETAGLLGLSIPAAKTRQRRACKLLRGRLSRMN